MKEDFSDFYLAGANIDTIKFLPGRGRAAACTASQRRAEIEPGEVNVSMKIRWDIWWKLCNHECICYHDNHDNHENQMR